ncbi:hypothetical protein RCL1_002577 [Eukaryota sp. TZLM3-RCL]
MQKTEKWPLIQLMASQAPTSPRSSTRNTKRSYFPLSCEQAVHLSHKPDIFPIYKDGSRPLLFTVVGKVRSFKELPGNAAEIEISDTTATLQLKISDLSTQISTPSYIRAFVRFRSDGNIMCLGVVPNLDRNELIYHHFSIAKEFIGKQGTDANPVDSEGSNPLIEFLKEKGGASLSEICIKFGIDEETATQHTDYLFAKNSIFLRPDGSFMAFI